MEILTSIAVMQCLLAIGGKRRERKSRTMYIALVTLESPSVGVKYRHGVTVVSLFSRDIPIDMKLTGYGDNEEINFNRMLPIYNL